MRPKSKKKKCLKTRYTEKHCVLLGPYKTSGEGWAGSTQGCLERQYAASSQFRKHKPHVFFLEKYGQLEREMVGLRYKKRMAQHRREGIFHSKLICFH